MTKASALQRGNETDKVTNMEENLDNGGGNEGHRKNCPVPKGTGLQQIARELANRAALQPSIVDGHRIRLQITENAFLQELFLGLRFAGS